MGRKKKHNIPKKEDKNDNGNNNGDINDGNLNRLSKKKILEMERELKAKQITNVPSSKKLRPSDIHRIVQHTNTSIFDEENCCIWTGYITNLANKRKGTYINFYFRDKKKVALHRLLYANFKGELHDKDYIKYSCHNKGKCCNINHMVKFEYNSNDVLSDDDDYCSDYSEENNDQEDLFKLAIF